MIVQVSRKLAFVEDELEVAEDRVKSGDSKIGELEEELKVTFICFSWFGTWVLGGTYFFIDIFDKNNQDLYWHIIY